MQTIWDPRLPKTSKFESKDRFDKHARIRDFKFLDKVLMKSNKTPVSLELEKFKWPFYISEIGRPLFLLPSGVHPSVTTRSSVGSFLFTRPIQFHPLRLIFQLIFFASVSAISRTVVFGIFYCHLIFISEALDLKGVCPLLFCLGELQMVFMNQTCKRKISWNIRIKITN